MHLKPSLITRNFGKIENLSETLLRSIFSTMVTGFEAYGTALCGHVANACPTEPDSLLETRPETAVIRQPQTKTFAVKRDRSNVRFSTVSECQL